MADDPWTAPMERIRIMAEQRGVTRAVTLLPAQWRSAVERAAQPLSPPSTGATTEPAPGFAPDPCRSET
jgi:hypothetical protein